MSDVRPGARKVLLLCHVYPGAAGAIVDHIEAFGKYSENEYFVLSNLGDLPEWLDLARFDALVFHYSLVAAYDSYISPAGRRRIREFQGFKAAFVQDDYRWVNDTVTAFRYMRINALFPLTNPDIMDAVYDPQRLPGVRRETVLAGYVPQELARLQVKPYHERPVDVGYRARKLPAWMGSHTLQKWQICERFAADAPRYGLRVDLSWREEDRIYADAWIGFISNCKATLGTESGASLCDFTGEIQKKVEAHLLKYPDDDYEAIEALYFPGQDGRIMMNVISPRCFESAALRTLMILYEGEYSGILKPWRHYVPLRRDHANMDEVVDILRSPAKAQAIVDRAYEEIACNEAYSYRAMVRLVDRVMNEEWRPQFARTRVPFTQQEFDWCVRHRRGPGVVTAPLLHQVRNYPVPPTGAEAGWPVHIAPGRTLAITQVAAHWSGAACEEGATIAVRVSWGDHRREDLMVVARGGRFGLVQYEEPVAPEDIELVPVEGQPACPPPDEIALVGDEYVPPPPPEPVAAEVMAELAEPAPAPTEPAGQEAVAQELTVPAPPPTVIWRVRARCARAARRVWSVLPAPVRSLIRPVALPLHGGIRRILAKFDGRA